MSTVTAENIQEIIKQGRSTRVDWFSEQAQTSMLANTIGAMANSQGGTLLIGIVGPAAAALGVRNTEQAVDRVLQIALSVEPRLIIPVPQVVEYKNQSIVVAFIPNGMPHVYAVDGRFLRRNGMENQALKPAELRRLIIERGEVSFEMEVTPGTSLEDIDWEKAEQYASNLRSIGEANTRELLLKRGCLTLQGGELRPTNAGILLFGKDPQRHIRGAEITAARFAGETMSDTFSRQDLIGPLPDQIRRAETFLIDHLRKGVRIRDTMAREEQLEYPLEAARELVVNAVAHRDYSIHGDGIRLFLFKDRMEITSPGGLPGPVTIDNIKDERFSRNPAIVQVLSDMGFIERLGYGVDRVIDLMKQQHLSAPEFQESGGGFRALLRNHMIEADQATGQEVKKEFRFDGKYRDMDVNPRQESALIYLHSDGITRITNSDLQELCPDVHPETIRRDLVDLVTKDILQKMGQKRGSYYILKRG